MLSIKNIKFLPSTIFINESQKYKYLRSYIDAKKSERVKKKIYLNNFVELPST